MWWRQVILMVFTYKHSASPQHIDAFLSVEVQKATAVQCGWLTHSLSTWGACVSAPGCQVCGIRNGQNYVFAILLIEKCRRTGTNLTSCDNRIHGGRSLMPSMLSFVLLTARLAAIVVDRYTFWVSLTMVQQKFNTREQWHLQDLFSWGHALQFLFPLSRIFKPVSISKGIQSVPEL